VYQRQDGDQQVMDDQVGRRAVKVIGKNATRCSFVIRYLLRDGVSGTTQLSTGWVKMQEKCYFQSLHFQRPSLHLYVI